VRGRCGFRDVLLGSGLVVAVTTMLSVAAALAAFGLVVELSDARVVVFTQRTPLVASQAVEDADRDVAADDAEAEGDPAADPEGIHADASASHLQPASLQADAGEPPPATPPARAGLESPTPEPPVARVRPTPGPRGAPRPTADLPIVMYHHVGPLPPNPDVFRRDLTVSAELFERTLERLAEQGVETVTLSDLFEHFAGGAALPRRAVVLTFDDGYDDNYEHAFRLLKQRGMVGTFFVTTDFVERPGYLTWSQIAEMAEAGMEIAAHSANHADFTRIGPNELKRQLVEPKAILEHHVGQPVRFLAYPAGKYNAAVIAASRAAGYAAAVTVLHGTRHVPGNALELRRVRARGADTVSEIVARLAPPSWRQ
jgi:peptidoglycan/xylan/chitin deacetylase (PgdA/CDA1 family)